VRVEGAAVNPIPFMQGEVSSVTTVAAADKIWIMARHNDADDE
jgi:hypothetical protein